MIAPFILCIICSALAGYSLLVSGAVLSDLMLLALVAGLASLILLLLGGFRRRQDNWPSDDGAPRRQRAAKSKPTERYILVDGSNVMHWKDELAQLATVCDVVQALTARGFSPGVMFDANVGYKLGNRYQDDRELAQRMGLPEDRVLVVPKGTPADPYLLNCARDLGARVVTNDRFRDWAAEHPLVWEPGFLIRGGYRNGKLWFDEAALTAEKAAAPV